MGGGRRLKKNNYNIKTFGYGIIGGGAIFYRDAPPPLHDFQVLPAAHSVSETPGARAPGRAESGGGHPGIGWSPSETGDQ